MGPEYLAIQRTAERKVIQKRRVRRENCQVLGGRGGSAAEGGGAGPAADDSGAAGTSGLIGATGCRELFMETRFERAADRVETL